jgi:hypothetical protein
MRFHVLGVPHARTTREYSADAFTQKVRLMCKMLTVAGHEVYHYGTEGSDPVCEEHVSVLRDLTFRQVHQDAYDWKASAFLVDMENKAFKEFEAMAIVELNSRVRKGDFLLCSFGLQHKRIASMVSDSIAVEMGIGYEYTFAEHRIFESYAWMNYLYGKEGRGLKPNFYDAVIPNYYDLDDYLFSSEKDDYFFFIARPTILKGLEIAVKSVEAVGGRLVVAGQGKPPLTSSCMEFVGVVSIEERARLMSRARATFTPTYYIEPFGGTVVESLLCGTPVIATDMGAFPETVPHGKVGYRCRTMDHFIWATRNISRISPFDCRRWAVENYSMGRVVKMYEEYFDMLSKLYAVGSEGFYARNESRDELEWLTKAEARAAELKPIVL